LSKGDLSNIMIPIPPISVQEKLIKELDDVYSMIEKNIQENIRLQNNNTLEIIKK
jgi:restriction endonuclease S subunit